MKTAIEFIEETFSKVPWELDDIVKLMQEYAKQEAVEFAKWVREFGSINGNGSKTTEQLYKIWKDEQS